MANNFIIRTISAIVMAVIIIAAVRISPLTLLLLAGVITVGSMTEFFKLSKYSESVQVSFSVAIGLCTISLSFLTGFKIIEFQWLMLILPLIFALFITEMYRKKEAPIENIATALCGVLYIALPMSLLINMGVTYNGDITAYNYTYVLGYIVLIWTNDVGAYIVGMSIGKNKLFERLSPKKSWEGFFGGVIFTLAVALIIGHFTSGNTLLWGIIAIVLSLSAVAGDLIESMFKREAQVKDSGSMIPGHGGFLDRFDAMFISLPFVYIIIKIFS